MKPAFRVYWTSFFQTARGEAMTTFRIMTWDEAWDAFWRCSRSGLTAWIEPVSE